MRGSVGTILVAAFQWKYSKMLSKPIFPKKKASCDQDKSGVVFPSSFSRKLKMSLLKFVTFSMIFLTLSFSFGECKARSSFRYTGTGITGEWNWTTFGIWILTMTGIFSLLFLCQKCCKRYTGKNDTNEESSELLK